MTAEYLPGAEPNRYRTPRLSPERGNICTGCRPAGRCRFGVRLGPGPDGSVVGTAYFTAEHEGAGGVVHGGSTMSALDEACGSVVVAGGAIGVTAEFDAWFRRPVPVEHELALRAWPESRDERGHWIIHAEISLPGETHALAGVRARFVEMDPAKHYGRFQRLLARRTGGNPGRPG